MSESKYGFYIGGYYTDGVNVKQYVAKLDTKKNKFIPIVDGLETDKDVINIITTMVVYNDEL